MASILETDGYKFSMAEAGWPLRTETFYYSHRKGGSQVLPVDPETFVKSLLPSFQGDWNFLGTHGYETGPGYAAAMKMRGSIVVKGLPKGTRFFDREPVFSVTGPSALVSWLEPLVLQLNYRIQVATMALDPHKREVFKNAVSVVSCIEQREIIKETLDTVGVGCPQISVATMQYMEAVEKTVKELVHIVQDPSRIFEVGFRSVSCPEQHAIALQACREAGVRRTSNVHAAHLHDMIPVGTMGHEHVQRYGSDEAAFRAMKDRRPNRSSYLLDTYDTYLSGIPAAYKVMLEDPDRGDSIRYDSGDKMCQYLYAVSKAKALGLPVTHIIEDGLTAEHTRRFEDLRATTGIKPENQFYGYGGYIVSPTAFGAFTRDTVAAVYKLSQSGPYPVMKFSNEPGGAKESVPGKPVVFRRASAKGPIGLIGQEEEACPEGYMLISGEPISEGTPSFTNDVAVGRSDKTRALIEKCRKMGGMC